MAAVQKLAKQALVTFAAMESPNFNANLDKLVAFMDTITANDVNLQAPPTSDQAINIQAEAPVSHITIYECPVFSMGIFIVKKGCHIPLHDHPGMFGICKVLYGAINVKSYHSLKSSNDDNNQQFPFSRGILRRVPQPFELESERRFDENGHSCFLTPAQGNYHAIYAIPGPTAFLDILAPPYAPSKGRDCTYFGECEPPKSYLLQENGDKSSDENKRETWLIPIPPPKDFYCDSQEYTGPKVIL